MVDEDKLREIVKEECNKAKVSRAGLYIMMFITMLSSCDTHERVNQVIHIVGG